jgi:hypothetical protein
MARLAGSVHQVVVEPLLQGLFVSWMIAVPAFRGRFDDGR